ESAAEEQEEAWGGATVEGGGEQGEPGGHEGGQVREWHGRLLGRMRRVATLLVSRGPALVHPAAATVPHDAARQATPDAERPGAIITKSRKVQGPPNFTRQTESCWRAANAFREEGPPPLDLGTGPTTLPGVEPGPSTDGFPDGQGRLSFRAGTDRAWRAWR